MNEEPTADSEPVDTAVPVKPRGEVIAINESLIKDHLDNVAVMTVEETLNALPDTEADQLCGAKRNEHSPDPVDTRP